MADIGPEHRELSEVVSAIEQYETALRESEEMQELIRLEKDAELVELAREELALLTARLPLMEEALQRAPDPQRSGRCTGCNY